MTKLMDTFIFFLLFEQPESILTYVETTLSLLNSFDFTRKKEIFYITLFYPMSLQLYNYVSYKKISSFMFIFYFIL